MRMREGWEAEARNWEQYARTPGHNHVHENLNLPALLTLLPLPSGPTLDLGCGEGRVSRELQEMGYAVAGLDAAPTMVRLAAGHQTPIPAAVGDAAAQPFADEVFDLVVAYMSLHDIDDMPQAVAEAARVLRPGGRLCAAIPHPVSSAGGFQGSAPDAPFLIAGSYLDSAPVTWTADRGGIRVTFHSEHRPIEAYSRALEAAGLLVEAIREVRPPESQGGTDPGNSRWRRIPRFLHLRAMKPSGAYRQLPDAMKERSLPLPGGCWK
jgi:SAM-dependent methyltransferase